MGNDIRQKVDIKLFLEVLGQLPEVTDEEIADAGKVFEEAYGELPDEITFDAGSKKGDGEVFAFQRATDEFGRSYRTKLYIDEEGVLKNPDTGFEGYISWSVAKYFVASLFGFDELADKTYGQSPWIKKKGINPFSMKHADCFDKFDPFPETGECRHQLHSTHGGTTFIEKQTGSLITPQLPKLVKGAKLLYEAAVKKGGLAATASSEGAELIGEAEYQLITQLDLMTKEIWKDAEAIAKASDEKASVKDLMKKNEDNRPDVQPLTYELAMERYEAAVKMIRDIAAVEEDGFKEECCIEEDEGDSYVKYNCEYGVHGGKEKIVEVPNKF